jgi:hypothetical protein
MRKISKVNGSKNQNSNTLFAIMPKYNPTEKIDFGAMETLNLSEKNEIERKLKEIDCKIEDIGKICDKKKLKSYEDYNNVLKSNKAQFLDELTKLNFKLMEAVKQNTREDFLKKLRKDLGLIKNQVYDKDKELQANNNKLYSIENRLNVLQEEKEFYNKEIKNAKQYNQFLKAKLKELEEGGEFKTMPQNERSFNNTSNIMKTPFSPQDLETAKLNTKENSEKLEIYFKRNEEILLQKIMAEERQIKDKYVKYKKLETFNNPVLEMLAEKVKEYEVNLLNKVSNQEVFFDTNDKDLLNSSHRTTKRVIYVNYFIENIK